MGWGSFVAAGIALWPFTANGAQQIDLTRGDVVFLLERYVPSSSLTVNISSSVGENEATWFRGVVVGNCFMKGGEDKSGLLGIFPSSFIRLTTEEGFVS